MFIIELIGNQLEITSQHCELNGVPVSYCFMRGESDRNLDFYYQNLQQHNDLTKTKIVFVDKDLQNIRILTNFYTEATILLCVFHVLKWLRGKIFGDKYNDRDAKDAIWALVYSLVYAKRRPRC
jgi:hypothetical protein